MSGSAVWHGDHWLVAMQTPAGARDVRAARRRHAQRPQRAGGERGARSPPAARSTPIVRGLEGFVAVRGRSQAKRFARAGASVMLIDDSYNANPDSVRAAIDVLAALPAPRWLVLGDMGEVGDQGPAFHREVGAYASERGIESLWAAGAESANTAAPFAGARAFADVEALLAALARRRRPRRCSSRARASCAWSGSSPRSPASRREMPRMRSLAKDRRRHAA